ncbi:hypothetical protein RFI36_03615 [Acinetobacter gerneri]|uniref:Uncharacterized protein n=1 Tax=Acinetobacter gerneri TaxID=202952 RepID=A0AAW8JFQ9_9GAMM|nr:hypothetical protein [Acinetobacter gerneri]MDQ9008888.1 hypothetical protein [Acinetobacter gerneri]MDQ9012992.1 hypothetical protein [Acinetobacter gerneri]MDQ9024370.1 hypothetical protein [Acinetobacter gerneri]MDQ9051664.1 hypothetical protein [Acinetobacter gerneri]MDQ9059062.1 hypothetical protein [Acinetobacter gerneri]
MGFLFESQKFKKTYEKVLNLSELVLENSNQYDAEIGKLAKYFLSTRKVFNVDHDLSNYDKVIVYSTKWDRFDFINEINRVFDSYNKEKNSDNLREIILLGSALFYIYFQELTFQLGALNPTISIEVGGYIANVKIILMKLNYYEDYLVYAERDLPYQILKEVFHSNEIKNLADLTKKYESAKNLIYDWDDNLQQKKNEVERLSKKLESQKVAYDFVLLNEGFKKLYDQKKEDAKSNNRYLGALIAAIICLPLINLYTGGLFVYGKNIDLTSVLLLELPIITLLLIFIYFFKINLNERNSIRSQMIQLELRMALCQFIHSYADDSESLHKKNTEGFKKFENIIFSPIVASDDKIPSTFDGVDQIAKLIEAIKK